MIYGKRNEGSVNENTTGFFSGSTYVYKKNFFAKEEYKEKKILLEFEGVYMNAMVYVNGQPAGKCLYGYTNFFVDIGKHLLFNEENEIKVLVKTGMELTSRWYCGSGIYRKVNLLIGDKLHIKENGIKVKTKNIDQDGACMEAVIEVAYDGFRTTSAKLVTEITDIENKLIIRA